MLQIAPNSKPMQMASRSPVCLCIQSKQNHIQPLPVIIAHHGCWLPEYREAEFSRSVEVLEDPTNNSRAGPFPGHKCPICKLIISNAVGTKIIEGNRHQDLHGSRSIKPGLPDVDKGVPYHGKLGPDVVHDRVGVTSRSGPLPR